MLFDQWKISLLPSQRTLLQMIILMNKTNSVKTPEKSRVLLRKCLLKRKRYLNSYPWCWRKPGWQRSTSWRLKEIRILIKSMLVPSPNVRRLISKSVWLTLKCKDWSRMPFSKDFQDIFMTTISKTPVVNLTPHSMKILIW